MGVVSLKNIIIGILGLYIGYLITACIDQISKGEFILLPPLGTSHCMNFSCIPQYVPILHCFYRKNGTEQEQRTVIKRDLSTELLVCVLSVLVYRQYGFSLCAIPVILLVYSLIAISIIDMDSLIIPDIINAMLGAAGILFLLLGWTVSLLQGILGLLIGGGSLLLLGYLSLWILKKEGMGGGDIKLMAVCGLYLGVQKTFLALLFTGYMAGIVLIILILFKKLKKNQYIPFGPFLSGGIIVTLLFYEDFMQLYWRLLY
jgi:leader peptidase (prepilin peptidase)/N-methyltransferase